MTYLSLDQLHVHVDTGQRGRAGDPRARGQKEDGGFARSAYATAWASRAGSGSGGAGVGLVCTPKVSKM